MSCTKQFNFLKFASIILAISFGTAAYALVASNASKQDRGFYLQAVLGYNRYALKDVGNRKGEWSNGLGNVAFGGALGYQCWRNFSLEAGGIYTPNASAKNPLSVDPLKKETFKPRQAYFAGKLAIMTYDRTHIFTKLGLGYQRLKVTNGPPGTEKLDNWGAMFGAGTSYQVTPAIYVILEWLRFTGKIQDGVDHTTAPNIFFLGFGYKF